MRSMARGEARSTRNSRSPSPGAGSGSRNAPELPEQEAGDGLVVRVVERGPQVPLERRQRIRPFHEERRAVAFGAARGLVVLVEDVADDLLDEVLQRDEAGHGAALVHDDRHVEPAAAHLAEEVFGTLELGHEDRGAQMPAHLESLLFRVRDVEEILDVEDADDVVGVLPKDRIAAVAMLAAHGLDLLEGRGDRKEDDARAGHHGLLAPASARTRGPHGEARSPRA